MQLMSEVVHFQLPTSGTFSSAHRHLSLLNINLGVYLGYAVSRNSDVVFEGSNTSLTSGEFDAENLVRSFDYGLSFGLQLYHHKLSSIFIRMIYDLSLSSFFNEENILVEDLAKRKLSAIILFIGKEF
jgi:hypothetical protein